MNQFDQGSTSDGFSGGIYIVLMAVAVIALAVAVGVVAWKNLELTGAGSNPFALVEAITSLRWLL